MDLTSWEKAKDIIADALDLPSGEREAFLHRTCPDAAFRAEIDALLKEYDEAPDFLERPPSLEPEDPPDEFPPGTEIGPYIVIDRLGHGGMGQVLLGNDRRLRRKVALKCLITSPAASDDRRPAVLTEARAAARINHPNVAAVHDVIEHGSRAFIVMEYVAGESLAVALKRGRLPMDRVIAIGRQLAAGVAAAHAAGIVHRDLKPGNIQIGPDGSVKVLDFGVAQATMATASTRATTTLGSEASEGVVQGTPGYMSPEQRLGRKVDERSDVFSLGVVLYEMATGRRPPAGAGDAGAAPAKRLPRADAVEPGVPRAVADVIARALELDPDKRFPTAAELGSALEAIEREARTTAVPAAPRHGRGGRMVLKVAAGVALLPALLLCLGLMNSAAFNVTLQRTAPFNAEPLQAYIIWGLRSLVAPLFYMTATVLVAIAMRFVGRVLGLFNPVGRRAASGRARLASLVAMAGLDDPIVLAQALATLGLAAFAIAMWHYSDLIAACISKITTSPPSHFALIAPDNAAYKSSYGIVLDVLTVAFGAGLWRVVRLRAEQGVRQGGGVLMVGLAILTLLVLANELPYRILWSNQFERIEVAGARCYVIGEHGDEWLTYCPELDEPRNRIIARIDPRVRRTGVVESIFTSDRR